MRRWQYVKVTNRDSMFYGRTGVVLSINKDYYWDVLVKFSDTVNGRGFYFAHSELKRIDL